MSESLRILSQEFLIVQELNNDIHIYKNIRFSRISHIMYGMFA